MFVDSNFHFEVRDLFLRPRAGCCACIRDLLNGAFELAFRVSVNRDSCFLPGSHVDNVVFVYVHARFHMAEVGHTHDFCPRELVRRDHPLTELAI